MYWHNCHQIHYPGLSFSCTCIMHNVLSMVFFFFVFLMSFFSSVFHLPLCTVTYYSNIILSDRDEVIIKRKIVYLALNDSYRKPANLLSESTLLWHALMKKLLHPFRRMKLERNTIKCFHSVEYHWNSCPIQKLTMQQKRCLVGHRFLMPVFLNVSIAFLLLIDSNINKSYTNYLSFRQSPVLNYYFCVSSGTVYHRTLWLDR
jgi:hypothetical protein